MERTRHIPQRSRQAKRDMIDLTAYYGAALDEDWLGKSGANLASLPGGVQAFALAAFDVRGLIQLGCKRTRAETGIDFPQSVEGIPIHYLGRKLHFLHGAAWSAEPGTPVLCSSFPACSSACARASPSAGIRSGVRSSTIALMIRSSLVSGITRCALPL